ncbi:MAG: hypothetical protein ACR2HR_09020 [Euzebya sp.]
MTLIILVIALAAAGTVAAVQTSRLQDAQAQVSALEQQSADDASQIADLQQQLDQAATTDSPPGGLEDLLGGSGLEDLLGEGGLEDLFGEGGLEDLFGGGGLGDVLGGLGDAPDIAGCTTDVVDLPDVSGTTLQQQFDQASDAVQQLRGETFPQPITPTIKTDEEIRSFFAEEIADSYPADTAEEDRRILAALQAAPADIDLVQTQIQLLGDQVAGYYDDETRELVVRAADADEALGGVGLIVLAHELEHALTDATVGLPDLDGFGADEDGAIAALSVVEGSAVALQTQFQLSALDPLGLLSDPGALAGDQGLDQVPYFLAQSLIFPYFVGPGYVCGLYSEGGWPAVDQAIADPPTTTHALMFPGTTTALQPLPSLQGPQGYEAHDSRTFGAAPLSWLFGAPGQDQSQALADPVAATQGWQGGQLSLWTSGENSAVALTLAGADLCEPVTQWWQAASGGETGQVNGDEQLVQASDEGTWGVVSCAGQDIRVGIGPSPEVARSAIA